jgi:hypothetical protein
MLIELVVVVDEFCGASLAVVGSMVMSCVSVGWLVRCPLAPVDCSALARP